MLTRQSWCKTGHEPTMKAIVRYTSFARRGARKRRGSGQSAPKPLMKQANDYDAIVLDFTEAMGDHLGA